LEFLSYLKTWHDKPVIMLSSLSPRGAPERIEALKRGAVGSFNKANAIKDAPLLIKMIKDAAHGKLKADPEDAAALALVAAQQMGQFASLAA
jgi:chemotaxis response regulator CheB